MKGDANAEIGVVLVARGHSRSMEIPPLARAHMISVPISLPE